MDMTMIILMSPFVITCLFGCVYLLAQAEEKELDAVAKATTVIAGFITALSLLLAAYTYYDSTRVQKTLAASNIYQEHMKLSIEKEEFLGSSDLASNDPVTKEDPPDKQKKYEQYKWYVGHALFSFESILEVAGDDENWKKTFVGFICDHKKYLGSGDFHEDRYREELRDLIAETLRNESRHCR